MALRGVGAALSVLAGAFCGLGAARSVTAKPGAAVAHELPLVFEGNRGQVDGKIRYLGRARDYTILFRQTEVVCAAG